MEGEEEELGEDDHLEADGGVDDEEEEEEEKKKKTALPQELSFWARIYRMRSAARWHLSIFEGNCGNTD